MSKNFRGSLLLLLTSFIWGTAFVAQSAGMNYIRPFTYNALRTLLGGVVLIPVIAAFKYAGRKKSSEKSVYENKTTVIGGIVCGLCLFAASSLQQAGIAETTAGKAGFITALYIVIVPVISIILGKHIAFKMWLFVLTASVGFWLMCIKDDFSVSTGDLLVLASAGFYALHIIIVDRFNAKNADGMVMSCIQFFTAGLIMLACMFIFEEPRLNAIIDARFTIAYTGIMSCGVAYTLQIIGQKHSPPSIAALIMSLESVFALLSGFVILHESLSVRELSGCILVFASAVLAQLPEKRPKNTRNLSL